MKLSPNKAIRNNQTSRILEFVAETYTDFWNRFDVNKDGISFTKRSKLSYYIYIEKNKIEFYFIVSKEFCDLLIPRLYDVWKNMVTIKEVENIPKFDYASFYLNYKYEDALSLRCDNRDNDLISSILNVNNIMHEEDKVGLIYNFTPIYQKGWISKYCNTIEKVKNGSPYYKEKTSAWSLFCTAVDATTKFVDLLLGAPNKSNISYNSSLSDETREKKRKTILNTQIVCAGSNKNAVISMCEAFHIIDKDNMLMKKNKKMKLNYEKYKLKCPSIITSTSECQSFVSLPGDTLLKQYKIEHTDILEKNVPEELCHGYICLGTNTCRGKETKGYIMDDVEIGAMPLVLDGEQGAGKTSFLGNYIRDIQTRGEGCIVIDYIKNCELCDAIKKVIPKDRIIEIDMSDIDNVQGIGYNELKPRSNSSKDIVDCANMKAGYISRLVNALSIKDDVMSARMERYLNAASNVVMCCENASLKDIMKCLNDHEYRQKLLKAVPRGIAKELEEEIAELNELNEVDDKTGKVTGTKYSKIEGINDRIARLKKDYRLKKMFYKSCENNVDLVDAMEKGKVVLIRMPQIYFSTPYSKNVVVTYLFTKIWTASIVRGMMHSRPKRFHVIVDEIFQAPEAMNLIEEEQILPQTRKFQTKFVFSCQYQKQISPIASTLDAAGASYMLMKGASKANFDDFKDQIAPFTLEDLQSLKQYHCLNIMNTPDGKKVFTTKLPKPI